MDNLGKTLVLLFVVLYVLSPVDFFPGPVDDLLLVLLASPALGNSAD